ncbi:M48 family metalloprotease [soil metagenome]
MKKLIKNFSKYRIANIAILTSATFIMVAFLYSCGANLYSVSDDVKIGKDLNKQILANPREYPMLQGHDDVKSYVSNIGNYIVNSSNYIQYKGTFPYTFQIVKDDSTVNAFSIPGGFIYVYTGLMKFVDNEATLAGIMAHEIAHAEKRHMTQRLTSYYGVSMILGLVLGNNPSTLAQIGANLFVGLGFLANSRADEKEADDYSMRYLSTTKYYPGSIIHFFYKIRDEQRKKGQTPGGLDRLLATHPLPQDRIDNILATMKKMKVTQDSTRGWNTEVYQNIKAKLQ